ncbi:MAG TPA: exonuclease domain-containing protein [Ignavibacteriaceae bacterium]|nr:exonuclease domain-containing protein [Ignavibacteriaceae bacterium]
MGYSELLKLKISDATFSVLDVETTGISPYTNSIIEIGIVKVKNSKITDTFSTFVNPCRYIPPFITQLTGISNRDVDDAPMWEDIYRHILDFLESTIVTGHNLAFDYGFLRKEFQRVGLDYFKPHQLCTLRLAKRLYPELKSRSLGNLANHLNIKNPSAHRALSDAKTTAFIMVKLLKELSGEGITHVDELLNYQYSQSKSVSKIVIKPDLLNDVHSLPKSPGVYYFLNSKNRIIYIGKAKSLKDRVKSYFSPNSSTKSKKIVKQAQSLKIEETNSELTALLLEAELIKVVNPRLNVQLKKYNDKYFLRISNETPFPRVELINYFDFDGNDYFGVFVSRKKAEEVLRIIDSAFMLRECSDKEFSRKRQCLLADIERCTAPCVNNGISLYANELSLLYGFIFGENQFSLNRLLEKMRRYSDELKFEKAAEVKDTIQLILSQVHKSALLAEPINSANVLMEICDMPEKKDYILLLEGKIFVRNTKAGKDHEFMNALEDYFGGTLRLDNLPTDEDLEKMKITLNWIIRNRTKTKIYYLKKYQNKENLFKDLGSTRI